MNVSQALIEMKNVFVRKEDKNILNNINLKIECGERVAILGQNGSGKSSLIKTMTGEYRCDSARNGNVKIYGNELWKIFDIRKAFGIVSNEIQTDFRKDMTAEDAVLSGFFGSIGTNRSQDIDDNMRKKADSALESVCAAQLKGRRLKTFSSGEMRRIIMARALVNDPEALILDEPMNSLDIGGKYLVRRSIEGLADTGHTLIMVTHDPADIGPEFKRIIMIKDGVIIRDGGVDILTNENLSELYGVSVSVYRINERIIAEY